MAQGQIKKPKSGNDPSRRSSGTNVLAPKKGARSIAPKKASLIQKNKVVKKFSAGLTAKTERALAEKAGHLEMLGGGKKDKKKKGGTADAAAAVTSRKDKGGKKG